MPIMNNITNFISNHNVIPRAIGAIGLGTILWDTHKNALMESDIYAVNKDVEACLYYTHNAMQQDSLCRITEKVKEASLRNELDWTWRRFFNLGIGYVKGFGSNIFDHIVPTALATATLVTKGLPSKICAGALAVYAAFKGIKHYFGLGNPKNPLV